MNISVFIKPKYNLNTSTKIEKKFEKFDGIIKGFNSESFDKNSSMFMFYGESGSGKTYSMKSLLNSFPFTFPLKTNAFEIYNNQYYDITFKRVRIYDLNSLTNTFLDDREKLREFLHRIQNSRISKQTQANLKSSRGFLIISIYDKNKNPFVFVDLAGNESQINNESSFINKSLLYLRDVVRAIHEKQNYVPFRRSKLTFVLSTFLEKIQRINIICTIIPTNFKGTNQTLEYAASMKNIKIKILQKKTLSFDDIIHYETFKNRIEILEKKIIFDLKNDSDNTNLLSLFKEVLASKQKVITYLQKQF